LSVLATAAGKLADADPHAHFFCLKCAVYTVFRPRFW
jgi:hypothetical protein